MKRSRLPLVAAIVAGVAIAGIASAAPSESKYLVTAPHTKEECLKALDEVKATSKKLLEKFDWGCMSGDHTGYLMVEARDEAAVRKMLPSSWGNTRIQPLNKFTPAQIESFHKK
jgi:hypothetical protein